MPPPSRSASSVVTEMKQEFGESGGEDDAYNVTKSVLARKRQLAYGLNNNYSNTSSDNASRTTLGIPTISATATSEQTSRSCTPPIPLNDGTDQPLLNKYIEGGLILTVLSATLLRENIDDYLIWSQLSILTFLKSIICTNKLGRTRFPQDLYLWAFPVMLSFTCGPDYMRWLNQILSLSSFMSNSLESSIVEAIFLFVSSSSPLDYIVSPLDMHHEFSITIAALCGVSLTESEISLFSSLFTNLAYLQSSFSINAYIQALIFSPFISFVVVWPLFIKVINLSKIIGSHRRPKNADSLKRWYANIIYFIFPIIGFVIFGSFLEVNLGVSDTSTTPYQVTQFIYYLVQTDHLYMLAYWCVILILVLPIVMKFSSNWQLDLRRKVWHLCVVTMFLPCGANVDPGFTSISMTIALVLFIISEIVRATTLPPFGQKLHRILMNYTDHRDTYGPVIVSHIFLLLGIYLPILFVGSPAGIICLGLGDSSASTIGRRFGKYRIFGKKTLEGTISFILGVILGLWTCIELIPSYSLKMSYYGIFITAFSTAMLEATGGMNDNVIVPLYMLVIYQLVKTI